MSTMYLLYCNTDVVIVKGWASTCSSSLKTTRRLTALDNYVFIQKKKFVNIHIPLIQFWFTVYGQYTALYCPMMYIDTSK